MTRDPMNRCLLFWQWFESLDAAYKPLARAVRCILTAPASSVESERVWSTAGRVVADRRTCLSGEMVEAIVRLNKNWWVLNLPDSRDVGVAPARAAKKEAQIRSRAAKKKFDAEATGTNPILRGIMLKHANDVSKRWTEVAHEVATKV
jgi:hypothetical protein